MTAPAYEARWRPIAERVARPRAPCSRACDSGGEAGANCRWWVGAFPCAGSTWVMRHPEAHSQVALLRAGMPLPNALRRRHVAGAGAALRSRVSGPVRPSAERVRCGRVANRGAGWSQVRPRADPDWSRADRLRGIPNFDANLQSPWPWHQAHPLGAAACARGTVTPWQTARRAAAPADASYRSLCSALAVAAFWLLGHPYEGDRHDGVFYAAAALQTIDPGVFASDLFFVRGSFSDFSIFGKIHGAVTAALGLRYGTFVMYCAGQLAWLTAMVALVRRLAPASTVVLALGLMSALNFGYGEFGLLHAAEGFVTARPFGEAAGIWALALALSGRPARAVLALAAGLSIHPLMVSPAVGILLGYWALRRRLALATIGALLVALMALVIFWRLAQPQWLQHMDEAWLELVRRRTPNVLPSQWSPTFWIRSLVPVVLLAVASRGAPLDQARLYLAVACVGVAGLALAVVGEHEGVALVVAAKPWRAVWLVQVVAAIALFGMAARSWQRDRTTALQAIAGIGAIVICGHDWIDFAAPALALLALYLVWASLRPAGDSDRIARATAHGWVAVFGVTALFTSALTAAAIYENAQIAGGSARAHWTGLASWVDQLGWLLFPAALGLAIVLVRARPRLRRLCLPVTALAVLASLLVLDRRSDFRRFELNLADSGLSAWQAVIPPDRTVFWPERLPMVWLVLRRSSYVSRAQASIVVMHRAAGFEALRRMRNVRSFGGHDAEFDHLRASTSAGAKLPTRVALIAACADPRLGFAVLAPGLDRRIVPDFVDPVDGRSYRLYDCERLAR
ncbi:MAG: hypothetical protein JSW68_08675 [Burkholderiales bacterium]|nr:MAG: hypothetical protein JSW68_08675 [Burkholderiales bacterium]